MSDKAPNDRHNSNTYAAARQLYAVYLGETGGLNYQGNACPQWDDLTQAVRDAWGAVAAATGSERRSPQNVAFALEHDDQKIHTYGEYA